MVPSRTFRIAKGDTISATSLSPDPEEKGKGNSSTPVEPRVWKDVSVEEILSNLKEVGIVHV